MLTTKEVRKIMHKHNVSTIYTNKNKNSNTVKCYMPRNDAVALALLIELEQSASEENVKINNICYHNLQSIIVKCVKV